MGEAVPVEVLRHFPIIPRIKSMFRCKSIAQLMSWHAKSRSIDGVMRVPADSDAWKHVDSKWPMFAGEARNIRLGLAMDGYNACPLCGPRLDARYSKALRKTVYEGHHRYLPEVHVLHEGQIGRQVQRQMKASD